MSIPSQNEFLLPFLDILSDGETYTRAQIMYRLAQHFGISEDEAQHMSGRQFTLVSRVAWCDVHFVKAGFVNKKQHTSDSMQDAFRITSLGVRERTKRREQITVGYLMSFYRGKVHRGAGADDTTSDAELLLSDIFETLPDAFTVFHSVKWFAKGRGSIGESDFIIAHPEHGLLVLEVKGGRVKIEQGEWYSTNYYGHTNSISDPCAQADRNRWALRDWLAEDQRTSGLRYAVFPAIALPDSRVEHDVRPDCPADIIIDMSHLHDLEARLLAIYDYWRDHADASNRVMDGTRAVNALVDLLVPTRQLRPRVAEIFERERREIEELTQQQFSVLKMLRRHKRAAIVGGAGTGKTMLAMEKAQQLAEAGYRVLFLCYNRNLAEWIDDNLDDDCIHVSTFHSLVGTASRVWAHLYSGEGLGWDEFNAQAPDILMDAASIIRDPRSGAQDKLFDAIIVDEAQDFEDTWWIALPELLRESENGILYVFFDDNQQIYRQISNVPLEREPFYLTENCRNTQHIHAASIPYTRIEGEVDCLGPEGRPVERLPATTPKEAKIALQRVLHRLVNEEAVPPEEIVVLTPLSERRSKWTSDQMLGNFVLTWDMETDMRNAIRVCTIYSFKGLESAVVILSEMDKARDEISDQLAYVGMSRARHHVVVIGDLPEPIGADDTG